MRQTFVGLPQGEQPPERGQQVFFHPGQEDGQGFWQGQHQRLRYDEVYRRAPFSHRRLRSMSKRQKLILKPRNSCLT